MALEAVEPGRLGSTPLCPLAAHHERVSYPAGASHLHNGGNSRLVPGLNEIDL